MVTGGRSTQQNRYVYSNPQNSKIVVGSDSESHRLGKVDCSTDAVQQQWMSDRPDLCEFIELHT